MSYFFVVLSFLLGADSFLFFFLFPVMLIRDNGQLGEIKLRHNAECKGLIVQIRYLKAKFVRESSFREELGYQKGYLLTLLAQSERG